MSRYVLRYSGSDPQHCGGDATIDAPEVVTRAGGRVIDEAPGMLLIEVNAIAAKTLQLLLPGWRLSLETMTPAPAMPLPGQHPAARGRRR